MLTNAYLSIFHDLIFCFPSVILGMTSNLHCSECFFIKFMSGLISRGNEYRCQDAIESHRGAFNEITGFSHRISAIEKKKGRRKKRMRLVQWDVDTEWNRDFGC